MPLLRFLNATEITRKKAVRKHIKELGGEMTRWRKNCLYMENKYK